MEALRKEKKLLIIASGVILYGFSKWLICRIRAHIAYKKGQEKLRSKLDANICNADILLEKKSEILILKAFQLSDAIKAEKYKLE